MQWSWRLGHINGAPVEIHWLFALLVLWSAVQGWAEGGLPGLLYSTALLLAIFACILLHEIGHAVQAQALNIPVRRIVVMPFGGLAQLAHMPERPVDELRVASAGPAVNAALGLIAGALLLPGLPAAARGLPLDQAVQLILLRAQPGPLHFLTYLALVNLGLVVFNLLPAFPLDGARILRSLLATLAPRAAATRIVAGMGWTLGIACLLLGLAVGRRWGIPISMSIMFVGLTALFGTSSEETYERSQLALQGIPVRAALRQPTWCLAPADSISLEVQTAMQAAGRSVLPVADGGKLVGLLTRQDVAAALARQPGANAGQIMQTQFVKIEAEADLWHAQQLLAGGGLAALPVLEGDQLQGMLTSADVLNTFATYPKSIQLEATQLISPSAANL